MESLVAKGLVKAIGISNFSITKTESILKTAKVVPAVNQVELHPFLQQPKLKEYCDGKGVWQSCALAIWELYTVLQASLWKHTRPWAILAVLPEWRKKVILTHWWTLWSRPLQLNMESLLLRLASWAELEGVHVSVLPSAVRSTAHLHSLMLSFHASIT